MTEELLQRALAAKIHRGSIALLSAKCICGACKLLRRAFCGECYLCLPGQRQAILYSFIGQDYEAQYDLAVADLIAVGRLKAEETK